MQWGKQACWYAIYNIKEKCCGYAERRVAVEHQESNTEWHQRPERKYNSTAKEYGGEKHYAKVEAIHSILKLL